MVNTVAAGKESYSANRKQIIDYWTAMNSFWFGKCLITIKSFLKQNKTLSRKGLLIMLILKVNHVETAWNCQKLSGKNIKLLRIGSSLRVFNYSKFNLIIIIIYFP